MKFIICLILMFAFVGTSLAQSALEQLIKAEKDFAIAAATDGTKTAFLANLASDGIVFEPNRTNGIEFWKAKAESKNFLSWTPIWADVSASGTFGYTTGPWEFRSNGKDDKPVAFGHYISIWEKRGNDAFKVTLDIGISHKQTQIDVSRVDSPKSNSDSKSEKFSAGDAAAGFFELIGHGDVKNAYKTYAADDIRLMRENELPYIGKKAAISGATKNKTQLVISKRMSFSGTNDFAYVTNTYKCLKDKETVENGNFVQVWRFRDGKWRIVADIFAPVVEK